MAGGCMAACMMSVVHRLHLAAAALAADNSLTLQLVSTAGRRLRNAVRLLLSQPCNVCQPPELPCALPPSSSVHSCELAWFCSPECQKQAWPGHKQR